MRDNFYNNKKPRLGSIKSEKDARRRVEEQWNLITKQKLPLLNPERKFNKSIVPTQQKITSNIHKDFSALIKVTENISGEVRRITLTIEGIARILEDISKKISSLKTHKPSNKKSKVKAEKEDSLPLSTPTFEESKTKIKKNLVSDKIPTQERGLGKENSKKLYTRVLILRKKSTWKDISILLNSKNIPTFNGTGIWSPERLRYFMGKIEKDYPDLKINQINPNTNTSNRIKTYRIMVKMRSKNTLWYDISAYLNKQNIPTLSGKTIWSTGNAIKAFKKLQLENNKKRSLQDIS